jgi:hypothetical protein
MPYAVSEFNCHAGSDFNSVCYTNNNVYSTQAHNDKQYNNNNKKAISTRNRLRLMGVNT